MTAHTVYRKDYTPFPFELNYVHLCFDLHDHETFVEAELSFQRKDKGALHLYGDSLELISIELEGRPLSENEYKHVGMDLIIEQVPDQFVLKIKTKIFPHLNTHLSGLYQTNQLFCTQCEAEGFRRIMYFPDRPDVLTVYTTRIQANKIAFPILLSNGNLQETGALPDGRHWAQWHDPFKKPSYLFALLAGDLALVKETFTTCSGRVINLHLYVEHGQTDKCAHALASLQHAMRWDEEHYGREYDLDTYMIVAVSDFNMGAMENKGLNIFNAKYILASPNTATDTDYTSVEDVVGHEYFHNWSGNRVTCRDWFQLSLKEGLTVFREHAFSGDRYAKAVKRIANVKLLRQVQFPEDAGPLAHPVRPDSYEEINNFYTATIYDKGSEVIRMQHTILGAAGFRQGMDLYFDKHDGKAVTIDDFVAAMETANHIDLSQFKRWYSQAGTPEVRVVRQDEPGKLTLTFTQSCRATPESKSKEPFHIPIQIAAFTQDGKRLTLATPCLELKKETQSFEFTDLPDGVVFSLLRDFSAPIKLHYQQSLADLLVLLQFETDGFAKWEAALQLALRTLTDWITHQKITPLPASIGQAYLHVLEDDTIDMALRAELLTPPSFEEVAACFNEVDVDSIEDAREAYRKALVNVIADSALKTVETLWLAETHTMEPIAFARRRLRNLCLALLCKTGSKEAWTHCLRQFKEAKTMTDELAALTLLAQHPDATLRQDALERFYQRWGNEALVLDKWFSAQAAADHPAVLQQIRALLLHPKFNMTNPNKVRAVIGAFTAVNPRYFHALDGSGYALLTEVVSTLDKINPQVAARLITPFTRFQRYEPQRRALMKAQLEHLANLDLSKDLREIVTKTLK
ncbi:MAG: aminopeptidase N [Gammaproteobacteria bacterium]|nr:aminopeptidase N [Gammaproteobacteria bacterium]